LLGDQLPQQTRARGAQRRSNGHFVRALDGAAEDESAEVDGREQQDEPDRGEQDEERELHVSGDELLQRDETRPAAKILRSG